jgi:dienelactone hydrolase
VVRKKQALAALVLGTIFLASALAFTFTPPTVKRTYNQFVTTSDGVPVCFDVFEPTNSNATNKPAVIIGHGVIVNKEMMRLIALELAQNGFVVVTFDFRGHGQSGGALPASMATFLTSSSAPPSQNESSLTLDILAIKGYLASRGDINMSDLGYVGYSMGGGAGFELLNHDVDFRAMVGIAPVPEASLVNVTTPRNLLLLVGGLDEVVPENSLLTVMAAKTGLPAGSVELDHVYGTFANGTAAEIVVDPFVDHFFAPYDSNFVQDIVNWNLQALRGSSAQAADSYPLLVLEVVIALASGLGFFWAVSGPTLDRFARRKSEIPVSSGILGNTSKRYLVSRFIGYGLVLSAPCMFVGAILLFTPLTVSSLFFMLLAGPSVATLLMVWRTYARNGIGFTRMYRSNVSTTSWRNLAVGAGLGVLLYVLLEFSAGNLLGIVPSSFRWEWLPLYFVAVSLALVNLLLFSSPLIAEKFGRGRRNGTITAGTVSSLLNIGVFGVLLLLVCLFLHSFFFIMVMFPYIPIACILFFTSTYYYLRTDDVIMAAVTVAIPWTLIIVTLSPYFA